LSVAVLGIVAGCATPIGVRPIGPDAAERDLESNILNNGRPSPETLQQLLRRGLYDLYQKYPEQTLAKLREEERSGGEEDLLFALAELSFEHGLRSGDRRYFLASALYAYATLFPENPLQSLRPVDPRYRLAFDLYDRGLVRTFLAPDRPQLAFESGSLPLPFGTLKLTIPQGTFEFAGYRLKNFAPGADFEVRGLRNRYRTPGIGSPLLAEVSKEGAESLSSSAPVIPATSRIPVSVLLRIDPPHAVLNDGEVPATLELYPRSAVTQTTVAGEDLPLAFEPTAALAYTLEGSAIWDFELAGFFSGIFRPTNLPSNLIMLEPYRPGKIPVVLVHGTASSPARWTQLVNELDNDPRIWTRYQIWLFIYNTGNPVGYSGGLLCKALTDAERTFDPKGQDPALHDMVVIGHSQGGLLTKLTAIDSGTRFWDSISSVPFDQIQANGQMREVLHSSLFFEPLPFVKRVVFIATPHGGSYFAGFGLTQLISRFVKLPTELAGHLYDVARQNQAALAADALETPPTSITNMTPGNRFLRTLRGIPIAPGIAVNSIIAVKGEGPVKGGSDGVVSYESAHIEGVESEKIVRSGHSTQDEPDTIEEIRRILLKHAKQFEEEKAHESMH
jgi:pimeloyl-ACP methyl ester carboxylesterase